MKIILYFFFIIPILAFGQKTKESLGVDDIKPKEIANEKLSDKSDKIDLNREILEYQKALNRRTDSYIKDANDRLNSLESTITLMLYVIMTFTTIGLAVFGYIFNRGLE